MVYTLKNINEEAEVEKVEAEVEAAPETKQAAIDLLKDLLCKLEGECDDAEPEDEEEDEAIEVDAETCKESAQILVDSMKAIMESESSVEAKLEAVSIMNKALRKVMEAGEIEETDGGLPEEAAENEADQEICPETGERNPTDVDVAADNGEGELKESAAVALLRQMLKK